MTEQGAAASVASSARTPRLSWPPPGLEAMQGEAWMVIGEFGIGVIILALPLLLSIATQAPFWGLGPFGQSWWVPLATSLLALVVIAIASRRLSRLLRNAAAAARLGYGLGTIATVASDSARDSGFVLQGARIFAVMTPAERRMLLAMRITSTVCYLLAALWIPFGLAIAVLLAAGNSISPFGVWVLTLAPAALLLIAATLARITAALALRNPRKVNATEVADDLRHEAREWTSNLQLVADETAIANQRMVRPRAFVLAAIAVVIPAILLIAPVAAVFTSAAMGPVLASVAVPQVSPKTIAKMAIADAMRGYRLPADSSITPIAAGRALMNLSYAGHDADNDRLIQKPTVQYPAWPAHPKDWNVPAGDEGRNIFDEVKHGLTPEQRAYLLQIAAHPSQKEFATLGHVANADIAGAFLVLPLPDTLSYYQIPIMRFGRIRESAYMHVGLAAAQFMQGRDADAENSLKEIVTMGFVLLDNGNSLIENLVGMLIVGVGSHALENFYTTTGRIAEAQSIAARRDAAQHTADVLLGAVGQPEVQSSIAELPSVVANGKMIRGYRWQSFSMVATIAPCINLHNVVFGPGIEYETLVEQTKHTLIRYPADAEMFAVARGGAFGSKGNPSLRCAPSRIARVVKSGVF